MTNAHDRVTARVVPNAARAVLAGRLFGLHFPMRLEPTVFSIAGSLAKTYTGGYWHFYSLSNGGFVMAPHGTREFEVACPNGYTGTLSAEALGIAACMYAFSQLSFDRGAFSEVCAEHFHWLRAFAVDHSEASGILAACD